MFQNFQSYEDLIPVICVIYFLAILISYLRALKLDRKGIRTYAVIRSFESEEYWLEDTGGIPEKHYRKLAHIEFESKDHGIVTAKVSAGKYQHEKYRDKLPIIYLRNHPQKVMIDDSLHIYATPLGITLFGLVILLLIGGHMIFGK